MRLRRLARAATLAALAVAAARPAHAEAAGAAGSCETNSNAVPMTRNWPAPLDRTISLHARNVALREALDRLAAAAGISLSYSSDLLPLDRTVCVSREHAAAGDVLAELLGDAPVEPVVASSDRVVIAPARARPAAAPEAPPPPVNVLERVVVTGNATSAPERPLTVAVDVVSGHELTAQNTSSLSTVLGGAVPGMWVWQQSPSSLLASYGSVRGASSFGLSYPKIYIDGIEVANPLLVTQVTPETIDHIEVIRGPQEAALYGADAISGVVNIVTRHDGVAADGERATVRTSAGMSESDYAAHPVLVQDHTLSLRTGTNVRSAGLDVGVGTIGRFIPEAYSRELRIGGGLRFVGSRTSLTGTLRFYGKQAGVAASPLLAGFNASRSGGATPMAWREYDAPRTTYGDSTFLQAPADTAPQSVRQYTVGGTATFAQSDRWTHSFVAGIDGYRLSNVQPEYTPLPSAADSALRAARGAADRATLRLSSVAQLGDPDRLAGRLTFALEHSLLREQTEAWERYTTSGGAGTGTGTGELMETPRYAVTWLGNTGLTSQGALSWHDALFFTGGVRLERNDAFSGASQFAALPMFGAAAVRDFGSLTAKLRAAYGRGMRPWQSASRETTWVGMRRSASATLAPEEQAGTEAGLDLLYGRRFSIHATRFDQRAFGLIQPVCVVGDSSAMGGSTPKRYEYWLENVGAITNRGWELQSSLSLGRLGLGGALSLVDSRVQRTALDYTGDLRPGDRMLGVPARTASVTASWSAAHWFASFGAVRASDWVNYDRLAIARDFADSTIRPDQLAGQQLRNYWRSYSGVTRLRATFSRDLMRGFSFVVTGDNLLNQQRGEPDDLTILPGRTVTAGLKARF